VTSVIHYPGSGLYCLELASSIPASSTGAVISPYWYGHDTNPTNFVHAEYDGHCGLNGEGVRTYLVTGSTSTTLVDESFFAVIP
jgi:hypothetical protein